MRFARNLILTTAAAAFAAAVLFGAPGGGEPFAPAALAQQQPPSPEDLAADYNKAHDRVLADSAKKYEELYKWATGKKLGFTAINVRRLVLRYDPDNEEVRKFVGYGKTPDGFWIRNEARRDQIRDEADIEDPKAMKYPEKQLAADKSVIGLWKSLAGKCTKNMKDDAANAAAWEERAAACWERVLQVDGANEEAHKALKHPKFVGKYVRPEAIPFLKARDERKQGGLKRAQLAFPAKPVEGVSQLLGSAGLAGATAQTENFVVSTVHGKDVAARVAVWGERSLADFMAIHAPPEGLLDRLRGQQFSHCKDKEELKSILAKSGAMAPAELEKRLPHMSGTNVGAEWLAVTTPGEDSDDHIVHYSLHNMTRALRQIAILDIGKPAGNNYEDWLGESVAYDVTRRLKGTTLWRCVAFGKYGNDLEPRPGQDIWMELAKRQVEYDDDVPLTRLWKLKLEDQTIRGPETVKGYAFLQYLFELDAEKARRFVYTAIVQGTPAAVLAVYADGDTRVPPSDGVGDPQNPAFGEMERLDAKYREWILRSW